jgi:hypothetical protein
MGDMKSEQDKCKVELKTQDSKLEELIQEEVKHVHVKRPKASFEDFIKRQTGAGNWQDSRQMLANFFLEDFPSPTKEVNSQLKTNELDTIWCTLLALWLLEEVFGQRSNEWNLLAQKAKKFIKKAGIAKPDKIIRQMKYKLI